MVHNSCSMSPCLTPSLPEAVSSIVNSISTTSVVQGTRIQNLLSEKQRSPPTLSIPSAMFHRILSLSQLCSPFAGNEGLNGVPVERRFYALNTYSQSNLKLSLKILNIQVQFSLYTIMFNVMYIHQMYNNLHATGALVDSNRKQS